MECFPLKWSGSGSVIHNLFSDQGTSNKLMNPLRGCIRQFLWCAVIRVISDQWFWSSQRNTPLFSRYLALACRFNSRSLVNSQMYCHMLNIHKSIGCYLSETWTITNAPWKDEITKRIFTDSCSQRPFKSKTMLLHLPNLTLSAVWVIDQKVLEPHQTEYSATLSGIP